MPLSGRTIHLTIRSPSPTTIQYKVSNAPIHSSNLSVILSWTRRAGNLVVAIACVILAALQIDDSWQLQYVKTGTVLYGIQHWWADFVRATHWGKTADAVLTLLLCFSLLYALIRQEHVEESLLVIRGLGVQTSSSSGSYFFGPTTRFIPATQIQDILIHEAFKGFEVRFYLSIIVEDADEAVVVFPTLLPRRKQLEVVWRGARQALWGRKVESDARTG